MNKWLINIITNRYLRQTIVWVLLFCGLIYWEIKENPTSDWFFMITNEVLNLSFYAILIYFNFFYLIPVYLNQKKFWIYWALLILSVLILTPLKIICFYFKFNGIVDLQQSLIINQFWYFLSMFLVGLISTVFKFISDWRSYESEKIELEKRNMQSELSFLKSQINPHFLFNTLNNLYALTLKKSDAAPEIVLKLSEMMRYMLYECNEKSVSLENEIKYLKYYLDLEKLRLPNHVDIHFEVTGKVDDLEIAPLLFIPFIENAFKHGVSHYIENGYVYILVEINKNKLQLSVENSKIESSVVNDTKTKKSGGIGLQNARRRLDILYPNNYQLKIENAAKYYVASLVLELNN